MCPLPDDSSSRLGYAPAHSLPNEFSPEERSSAVAAGARRHRRDPRSARNITGRPQPASGRTSRRLHDSLLSRRTSGLCRVCASGERRCIAPSRRPRAARPSTTRASRRSRRDEVPELQVSLSVLSPPQPIRPDQVEIGRHGLLISLGPYRGLLLPQVPVEHGWDRITFLEQTCKKAGLPPNAWQTGARLEAFTAEIFGDPTM